MALHGLGKNSKDASKFQIPAAVGAAIFPPIYYAVLKESNAQFAMSVAIAVFGAALTYPVYLCISPRERKRLDKTGCPWVVVEGQPISFALQDKKTGRQQCTEVT